MPSTSTSEMESPMLASEARHGRSRQRHRTLASDDSAPTSKKRFSTIALESTAENRLSYREMLLTTPDPEHYICRVILFDETIRQSTADGQPLANCLAKKSIPPGIKLDKAAKDLAGAPGEKITEGLDGLRRRLPEYHRLGAQFARWRALVTIADGIPSGYCMDANAHALARSLREHVCPDRSCARSRARTLDGRRARLEALLRGHGAHPSSNIRYRAPQRGGRPAGVHLLIRPRPPGCATAGLVGWNCQSGKGPKGLPPPSPMQRCRTHGWAHRSDGSGTRPNPKGVHHETES